MFVIFTKKKNIYKNNMFNVLIAGGTNFEEYFYLLKYLNSLYKQNLKRNLFCFNNLLF